MKREILEPLSPDLAALLASDRVSAVPGAADRAAIWSRVESATGVGTGSFAAASGVFSTKLAVAIATVALGATVGYFALSLGAGAPVVAAVVSTQAAQPEPIPFAPPAARPPPVVPAVVVPAVVVPPSIPAPAVHAEPPPRPLPTPRETLGAERALVGGARAALASGDALAALQALDRHAREFPRGQLREEREALAVLSLARAGRADAARDRGARFLARHPRSIQRRVVESALASIP